MNVKTQVEQNNNRIEWLERLKLVLEKKSEITDKQVMEEVELHQKRIEAAIYADDVSQQIDQLKHHNEKLQGHANSGYDEDQALAARFIAEKRDILAAARRAIKAGHKDSQMIKNFMKQIKQNVFKTNSQKANAYKIIKGLLK